MHYTFTNSDTDHTRLFSNDNLYDHLKLKEPGVSSTPPDSSVIKIYIDAAVDYIERYTGVPLYPKVVKMFYPQVETLDYLLKFQTTSTAVDSVTYRDTNGAIQTYSYATAPVVMIDQTPNTVYFDTEGELDDDSTDITITYTIAAGQINPPKGLIGIVMMLAADLYGIRGLSEAGDMYKPYDMVLDQYKLHWRP